MQQSIKKYSKLISLLLAAIMLFSLTACQGDNSENSTLVYGSGDYSSINPCLLYTSILFLQTLCQHQCITWIPPLAISSYGEFGVLFHRHIL